MPFLGTIGRRARRSAPAALASSRVAGLPLGKAWGSLARSSRRAAAAALLAGWRFISRQPRIVVAASVRYPFGARSDSDGTPAPPCLSLARGGTSRFRWVLSPGSRTITVAVRNATGTAPFPTLTVLANPDCGVPADISLSAAPGSAWQTIGPLAISPSAPGAVWVILSSLPGANEDKLTLWDNIIVT